MIRRLALIGWLVVVWVALWQDLSVANVASGLVVATLLVLVFPLASGRARVPVRPWAVLRFAGVFVGQLVQANAIVAWQVLRPASTVVEGIVAVPLRTTSEGIATIVADAVTLTPGTLTIEIRRVPRAAPRSRPDAPFWLGKIGSEADLPQPERERERDRVRERESQRAREDDVIVLYVHVLQLGDPDDIRADVHRFEDLALAAFGPRPEHPTTSIHATGPAEETSP